MCVCLRERERESVCVCVRERERESVSVCVRESVCVCEREKERECVRVCARERERERERLHDSFLIAGDQSTVRVIMMCSALILLEQNTSSDTKCGVKG